MFLCWRVIKVVGEVIASINVCRVQLYWLLILEVVLLYLIFNEMMRTVSRCLCEQCVENRGWLVKTVVRCVTVREFYI